MVGSGAPEGDDAAALARHAVRLMGYVEVLAAVGAGGGDGAAAVAGERAWLKGEMRETLARLGVAGPRSERLAALDELFRLGRPPDPAPVGPLAGDLVAPSYVPALDGLIRFGAKTLLRWEGKGFDPLSGSGINLFEAGARPWLGAVIPDYRAYQPAGPGRIAGFPLRTRAGPGLMDPDVRVLKIEYDFAPNPGWSVRRVVDEIVELVPGYYLGKAHLRQWGALGWTTVAYFGLTAP
jgi:hypothetical protein